MPPATTTQPVPCTTGSAARTPGAARTVASARSSAASPLPAGSSTSSLGLRSRTSWVSTRWKPESAASDSTSAATPRAMPPAATADRNDTKASRRVERR